MFNPGSLNSIQTDSQIAGLSATQLKNLQRSLSWMAYPISKVDGFLGPNTRSAFAEFSQDIGEKNPNVVSEKSRVVAISKVKKTQEILRSDVLDKGATIGAITGLCQNLGIGLKPQIAYVLATAQWETNHTFAPVKEAYWKSEAWRKDNLHYYPYYGRGYVQLTWKRNYISYSQIMREKLSVNLDLALDPKIALFVLVHGFKMGKFTGRKLEDYVNRSHADFKNARRCINGLDKWNEIKTIAEGYLDLIHES